VIAIDGHADKRVADQADHEDNAVHGDQHPVGEFREYVLHHQLNVVLVRYTIVVRAIRVVDILEVAIIVREWIIIVRVLSDRQTRRRRYQPRDNHRHNEIHIFMIHVSILLRLQRSLTANRRPYTITRINDLIATCF